MDTKHSNDSIYPNHGVISPRRRGSEPASPRALALTSDYLAVRAQSHDEHSPRQRSLNHGASDTEQHLSQRGLHFLKRESTEAAPEPSNLKVDEKAEAELVQELYQKAKEQGLKCTPSTPFITPLGNVTPAMRQAGQAFAFALRYNNRYPDAHVLIIDFTRKVVQYYARTRLLAEKDILGTRCQKDLIVKWKFHIWFKGDKAPIEHSTYDENYRDDLVEILNLKETPNFEFPTIHQGQAMKKGRSGFTSNPRYLRLVHGLLFIYRSADSQYPIDSICLVGTKQEPRSSSSIRLHSEEREIFLKFPNHRERELWLLAMHTAKERGNHERELLVRHNKVTSLYSASGHRRRRHKRSKAPSRSALERGYHRNLDPNYPEDDASSVGSDDAASLSDLDVRSPRNNLNGLQKSRSNPYLDQELTQEHHIDAIPEDDERKKERTSTRSSKGPTTAGGPPEYEVRVVNSDASQVAIGFIEVEADAPLDKLRQRICEELDNVPKDFQFLRDFVPIGRRQEASKTVEFVGMDSTVFLRAISK